MNNSKNLNDDSNYVNLYSNTVMRIIASGTDEEKSIIYQWRTKPITLINYITKTLKKTRDFSLLELGSGRGFLVRDLLDQGFNIIGSDFNPMNIQLAKEINRVDLLLIDANNIPQDKKYDLVISIDLIEHLPNIQNHLLEVMHDSFMA